MLNLYEILEVSEKASKEVIDKAYKVLAKKYHPDLQEEKDKQNAEIKMKQINEAYDILCNDEKRREYDIKLEEERQQKIIEKERQIKQQANEQNNYEQNIYAQQYANNETAQNVNEHKKSKAQEKEEYQNIKNIEKEINESYQKAYNNYLRRLGYKVKEPWTWKRFFKLLKIIAIIIIIIIILLNFPPTKKALNDFYENNDLARNIIDIIWGIITGIGEGIKRCFESIFHY